MIILASQSWHKDYDRKPHWNVSWKNFLFIFISTFHQGRYPVNKMFSWLWGFCRVGVESRSSLKLMNFLVLWKPDPTEKVKRNSFCSDKKGTFPEIQKWREAWRSKQVATPWNMLYDQFRAPGGSWPWLGNKRSANLKGPGTIHREDPHVCWTSPILFHLPDSGVTLGERWEPQ